MDPVFNETVQIVEFDEGFDSEVFFMYVFLVAGLFLVLFLVYSLIGGSKGKKNVAVSKAMETGTTNDDVDYEWIPRSGNLIYPSLHISVALEGLFSHIFEEFYYPPITRRVPGTRVSNLRVYPYPARTRDCNTRNRPGTGNSLPGPTLKPNDCFFY